MSQRLRYNALRSALGASLTNVATAITFSGPLTYQNGTAVPTITGSNYIPLALIDPATGLANEIVYLTAYTTGASTGTISRGQEGYTAIAHNLGELIVHDATAQDFGIYTAYTPVWSAATTAPVLGNGTAVGQYSIQGPVCFVRMTITAGSTTTFGAGQYAFSLPTLILPVQPGVIYGFGKDNTSNPYAMIAELVIAGSTFSPKAQSTTLPYSNVTPTVPWTFGSGDLYTFAGWYFYA